jgi:hypothetical protein
MTRAEENKVRNLVHGFLHSDITAMEFREEVELITGRNTYQKNRIASLDTVSSTPTIIGTDLR